MRHGAEVCSFCPLCGFQGIKLQTQVVRRSNNAFSSANGSDEVVVFAVGIQLTPFLFCYILLTAKTSKNKPAPTN